MDSTTLVSDELEAGADLVHRFNQDFEVDVAFWLKESDEDPWYLYIASDAITDDNRRDGYRSVMRATSEAPSVYLDPFQVKVVSAHTPLAEAAAEINRKYPGRIATRVGPAPFGGQYIKAAYIYPRQVVGQAG
ncbi:hypothetical protein [Paludisphaera rhizosphaerae]|uniref:hypothetical protein n=1 Tax=Paludisphaera rhizosphaerae TaxID=2711216 RepID=UPI0013ED7F42|nr:hypothetical protein [Paludisphaera rhizosphaerae]